MLCRLVLKMFGNLPSREDLVPCSRLLVVELGPSFGFFTTTSGWAPSSGFRFLVSSRLVEVRRLEPLRAGLEHNNCAIFYLKKTQHLMKKMCYTINNSVPLLLILIQLPKE